MEPPGDLGPGRTPVRVPAVVSIARTEIPYRSQYASPELAAEFAAGRIAIDEDPCWAQSGALDLREYTRWARSGCGMACLQMILGARGEPVAPIAELGRRAIGYGAYEAAPARGFGPLIYAGFVEFVAAEFGLAARVAAPLGLADLLDSVAGDEVVIASVGAEIRALAPAPVRRGGHLVLVIDVSPDGRRLCLHDPAGDGARSARAVWLERDVFARFYAERGVAVALPR